MVEHFVAFWNLENLFGPEDHPPRIDWIKARIRNDLRGWTPALYQRKLAQLSRIIVQMKSAQGPDILGVCEVEDGFVLADLAAVLNAALPGRAYGVVHADNTRDLRGIDTAFIYDTRCFSVDPALIFNHFVLRRTGTRDILQATFRSVAGHDIVILCNHWPSRSGGAVESAGFRATAGETLSYWHERIREEVGTDMPIIALGDFNDDPHDASLRFNALAWRERGDVERARSARFFNLAWDFLRFSATDRNGRKRVLDGTLYFGGNGNIFDQILVNRPLLVDGGPYRMVEGSARVETFADMVSPSVSLGPVRFGLPRGNPDAVDQTGYSDHFPVSLLLSEDTRTS